MEIRILSAVDAKKLIFEEPGEWNVISIYAPGYDVLGPAEEAACADFQKLAFHDSWLPRARDRGDVMPGHHHVRKAIEFAADKDKILVHCLAGVSRSSAIAFVVACSRGIEPIEAAKTVLNPAIHAPNPLVVRIGAEILGDQKIVEAYEAFEQVAIMHAKQLNAWGW